MQCMDDVVKVLPALKRPTVSKLWGEDGFAVKAVVPRSQLVTIIHDIKQSGATDIIVSELHHVVP